MDLLTIRESTWRGVAAWRIESRRLVAIITRVGGHLAAFWDRRDGLNPLWQPPWPAADPTAADLSAYGDPPGAALLATIVGHNWCCDRFGPPRAGESRPQHGEAGVVTWKLQPFAGKRAVFTAFLPEARLFLRTTLAITDTSIFLDHAVRHDDEEPRAIEWAEHVNIGDPFLAGAEFTAGIDRVLQWPEPIDSDARFPQVPPEGDVPLRPALSFPAPAAAPCGDVLSARVRQGWWSAYNRAQRRRLTYSWQAANFPWLALWTQHRSRTQAPWHGQARVRGMECSTKPWPEGEPPASRAQAYLGRPTTCFIPPGRWREHRLRIEWEWLGSS